MTPTNHFRRNPDRAVSNLLAFVITFAVIVSSVGIIYGIGFGSLMEVRNDQQARNAQQTFSLLASDIAEIQESGVPKRSGQITLRDGGLAVDQNSQVTIRINDSKTVYDDTLGSLTYSKDDTTIGFEGGARFREDGENSILDGAPTLQCASGSSPAIVSLVVVESAGPPTSIGSSGSVSITVNRKNSTLIFPENITTGPDVDNVSIAISDSDFQEAWNQELNDRSEWNHVTGDTYRCQADRVYVRITVIEIEFEL